jgi:hypothetical protein
MPTNSLHLNKEYSETSVYCSRMFYSLGSIIEILWSLNNCYLNSGQRISRFLVSIILIQDLRGLTVIHNNKRVCV